MEAGNIRLRAYRSEDLPKLLRLFHETVQEVCAGEYTREQRDAWAPPPEQLDAAAWEQSLRAHFTLVAEIEGEIAGFADLDRPDYLDRLYVGKGFQRRGVASALAEAMEQEAFAQGAEAVRVHASLTAKPFFEKRGYRVEREQTVCRRGVELKNFAMRKSRSTQQNTAQNGREEGKMGVERNSVHRRNGSYWDTEGNQYLGAIVLPRYGAFLSEEKCRLLGDTAGKRVLEIGCGNGESLCYMGEQGASELWGLDLSAGQLARAEENLARRGLRARLVCAPMEEECGLPENYFDVVYSIYAIGWTTDLEGTFRRVASYLKKGGSFVFSWSHPIHKCVGKEGDRFVFQKSYFDKAWYTVPADFCGGEPTLSDRMLSAYINALAGAGFAVERMEEEPEEKLLTGESEQVQRARLLPLTFVLKARKL